MSVESQNLVWRPLTLSDAEAAADLLNAIDAEDHVWGQYTAEDAAEELNSPVDDLATSTLAVFDGPTMLGFSAVHYKPMAEIVHREQAASAVRPTHRRHATCVRAARRGRSPDLTHASGRAGSRLWTGHLRVDADSSSKDFGVYEGPEFVTRDIQVHHSIEL